MLSLQLILIVPHFSTCHIRIGSKIVLVHLDVWSISLQICSLHAECIGNMFRLDFNGNEHWTVSASSWSSSKSLWLNKSIIIKFAFASMNTVNEFFSISSPPFLLLWFVFRLSGSIISGRWSLFEACSYYAIVHPMRAQYLCTLSQARKVITYTWISSFALALPTLWIQVRLWAILFFITLRRP